MLDVKNFFDSDVCVTSCETTYEPGSSVVVETQEVRIDSNLFSHLESTQEGPAVVYLPPIGDAPMVTAENAQRLLDGVPPGPLKVTGDKGFYEVVDALGNVVAECSDRGYANLFAAAAGMARSIVSAA